MLYIQMLFSTTFLQIKLFVFCNQEQGESTLLVCREKLIQTAKAKLLRLILRKSAKKERKSQVHQKK